MNLYQASNQWSSRPKDERFNTLDELYESLRSRRMKSAVHDLKEFQFEAVNGDLVLNGMTMSNWAFDQLGGMQIPVDFLRRLPAELAAQDLNYLTQHSPIKFSRNTLVYDNAVVRAFPGKKYQMLWDEEVVKWVQDITGDGWYRPKALDEDLRGPAGLYAGDRDMFVFMVNGGKTFDDDSDEGLGRGIFVWNTEVYGRTFGFQSFLFRRVCGNHIVWDASDISGFSMRHFGQNFRADARKALSEFAVKYMNSAPIEQKAIKAAQKKVFASSEEDFMPALRAYGVVGKLAQAVRGELREKEQEMTVWNVMNAITAKSQVSEYANVRTSADTAAGKILASVL